MTGLRTLALLAALLSAGCANETPGPDSLGDSATSSTSEGDGDGDGDGDPTETGGELLDMAAEDMFRAVDPIVCIKTPLHRFCLVDYSGTCPAGWQPACGAAGVPMTCTDISALCVVTKSDECPGGYVDGCEEYP